MSRSISLALIALALSPAAGFADDDGFEPLFDGKSTAGWTRVGGKEKNWVVENGELITQGASGGWLSTEKTYGDFILKLEYQVGPGGNSGVFIRSPHSGDPAYTGMEIQVLDDDSDRYKSLKPFQYCGSVYGVEAAKRGSTKPAGQWNAMEITAIGPKVTVKLNGTVITEADLTKHADAEAGHPGIKRPDGYIGFQNHDEPVKFRNIAIKTIGKK